MPLDIRDFINGSKGHGVLPDREDYGKVALAVIAVFTVITLYAIEFAYFSKTFDIGVLLRKGALLGAIFGAFVAMRYTKTVKTLLEKLQISLFFIFLIGLTFPLFASLTNRLLSFQPVVSEQVEFVEVKAYTQSRMGLTKEELKNGIKPSGYYLFFVRNDRIERIQLKTPLFEDVNRSEMILLPIKKGLWGHDVVSF